MHLTALAPALLEEAPDKGAVSTMNGGNEKSLGHRLDTGGRSSVCAGLAFRVNGAIFNVGGLRSMQLNAVDGRFRFARTGFESSAIAFVSPGVSTNGVGIY